MIKLKIGDTVKVTKGVYRGKRGFIVRKSSLPEFDFVVRTKQGESGDIIVNSSELSLVKPKRKKAPSCDCLGHRVPISPNDCICSPDDANDLRTCKRISPTKEGKEICPKTLSGKHLWQDTYRNCEVVEVTSQMTLILEPKWTIKCIACGLIDDTAKNRRER